MYEHFVSFDAHKRRFIVIEIAFVPLTHWHKVRIGRVFFIHPQLLFCALMCLKRLMPIEVFAVVVSAPLIYEDLNRADRCVWPGPHSQSYCKSLLLTKDIFFLEVIFPHSRDHLPAILFDYIDYVIRQV